MAKVSFASSTFTGTAGNTLGTLIFAEHSSYTAGSIVYSDANRARGDYSGASLFYHQATPPSADYFVEAYVHKFSNTGEIAGVCARVDTAADTYYVWEITAASGSDTGILSKVVSGVKTQLGSTYTAEFPLDNDSRIAISAIGDQIRGYVGSVEVVAATDSDITAAGKAGLYTFGVSANGAGIHLDNWMAYRETTQYETPALTILTSHAAPQYATSATTTYETPALLINTRLSDGGAFPKLPEYTAVAAAYVYETPQLLITLATPPPDYISGDPSVEDGMHPLFWLNNHDWSTSGSDLLYETPALVISTTNPTPEWTRSNVTYETPSLLIALTQVSPEYSNTPTPGDIQYETPGLLIVTNLGLPQYSLIFTEPVFGSLSGIGGYAVNRLEGTIGQSLRLTGVAGRST